MAGAGPLLAALAGLAAVLIHLGLLQVPLPFPALGKVVNPVPEDVLPWDPRPLEGEFAPNERLKKVVRLFEGEVSGSESLTVAPDGRLVMLDRFNRVLRTKAPAEKGAAPELEPKPVAKLGAGRPLGAHFDAQGDLIVCDSLKGLLKYEPGSGRTTLLATHASDDSPLEPGSEVVYANDLDIGTDGAVYFSACTDIHPARNAAGFWDTFQAWQLDLVQGLPRGKLLRYDPATGKTHVLASGFHYANGVALAADESFVMLAETNRLRVLKLWLKGPKAGQLETVIDRLPGYPDGVSRASDGNFWVAMPAPVPPIARVLGSPLGRAMWAWLPAWARPRTKLWGAVFKLSPEGEVLDFLLDRDGSQVFSTSAVTEHDGRLWLGNLVGEFVSYLDYPDADAPAAAAAAAATAAQ